MLGTLLLTTGVTITLPQEVTVQGTELTVGAIATVTGEDIELVRRIEALSLGYAPAPGYSRLLDVERVAMQLSQRMPSVKFSFAGSPRCHVTPDVITVTETKLLAEAGEAMRGLFANSEARITAKGELNDVVIPRGKDSFSMKAKLPDQPVRAGAWNVPVELIVDGEVYRTVWTRWDVELWQRRYVLRRSVDVGEAIYANDFHMSRVALKPGMTERQLAPAAFDRAVARRPLSAGSIVTDKDVTRPVLVNRGDVLTLELTRGELVIRTVAFANQSGRLGDRIPVKLELTGKVVNATVTGPDTVELKN